MDYSGSQEVSMGDGTIKIMIHRREGKIKVEAENYEGTGCVNDIEEIQQLLGLTTIEEELKPEYAHTVEVLRARQ
jgi:hypothetical protein